MKKINKEQQQVAMLVTMLVIIVGVLLWFYRDKLLPKPTGEAVLLAPPPRMSIPQGGGDDLYDRDEFKALKRFGDVPVRPLETSGSPEPFITDTEEAR